MRAAKRGPKRRLLELAQHNADLAAQTELDRISRKSASRIEALERLRDGLALDRLPLRIECYDISNLGEQHPVGSMVVFEGGVPKKAHYRKFSVRDAAGQDDFAMMNQVLRRRFERRDAAAGEYDESFATLPDLVVVDGGKGQLSAAVRRARRRRRRGRRSSASPSSARRCSSPAAATRCRCRPTIPARCCCSASATRRTGSR